MKKLRYVILLLVVMVVLAGCRKEKAPKEQEIQNQTPEVGFEILEEEKTPEEITEVENDKIETEKENVTGMQQETAGNTEAENVAGAQQENSADTESGDSVVTQGGTNVDTEAEVSTGTQGGASSDTGVSTETTEQESTEVIVLPFVPVG